MKIVFEENDLELIEEINKSIETNNDRIILLADQINKEYGLSFEITNIAKANAFLFYIMGKSSDFEKESGIRIKELRFANINNKEKIINILKNAMQQIEFM